MSKLRDRLSFYLAHVRAGGRVLVLDRETPVAEIVPIGSTGAEDTSADEERLAALEREGIIRRGTGRLPPGFLDEPLPGKDARVLEALLEERETGR